MGGASVAKLETESTELDQKLVKDVEEEQELTGSLLSLLQDTGRNVQRRRFCGMAGRVDLGKVSHFNRNRPRWRCGWSLKSGEYRWCVLDVILDSIRRTV